MKMSDIIIPESFAQTHPRKEKIDACKEHWIKTGRQSKYIVVDKENRLTDGYVMYLVLKELGVDMDMHGDMLAWNDTLRYSSSVLTTGRRNI